MRRLFGTNLWDVTASGFATIAPASQAAFHFQGSGTYFEYGQSACAASWPDSGAERIAMSDRCCSSGPGMLASLGERGHDGTKMSEDSADRASGERP